MQKGGTADTLMISPSHYKTLLDLADFTAPFSGSGDAQKGGLDYVNDVSASGIVGQLYGLNVYMNHYIPKNRFGVFDYVNEASSLRRETRSNRRRS